MKKTLDQETIVEKILIAEVRLVEEETVIGDGEITNENGRAQFDICHIFSSAQFIPFPFSMLSPL
jgi:hypothetical protein